MVELNENHANELLELVYSYRRIVKECGSDLTTLQAEALEELKYECSSAQKSAFRKALCPKG